MSKDHTRDYARAMFRFYSLHGQPSSDTIESLKDKITTAAILDLTAVNNTLRILKREGEDETIKAIHAVYFPLPDKPLRKSEISNRITKHALSNFLGERTVWRKLEKACKICAKERNLNV